MCVQWRSVLFYYMIKLLNFEVIKTHQSNMKSGIISRRLLAQYCGRVSAGPSSLTMSSTPPTAMEEEDDVLLRRINNVGVITLNRPKTLNALNLPMIRKIYPTLKAWENDPTTSMVIIKGSGDKSFCAGGDIKAVAIGSRTGDPVCKEFFHEEYILNNATGICPVPYIALIDGITMGGGVGLSVHGQFRVATERTLFAMPETAIGLFPDVGGGHFLPRLPGSLGMYLALTGVRLKGIDVLMAGVATHYVHSDKIADLESLLLSVENPTKVDVETILDEFQPDIDDHVFLLQPHLEKISKTFDAPSVEGIVDNLKHDDTDWSQKQLQTLSRMSPTSMKITHRQIREGKEMTLQEVLKMEYRLSQRCMEGNDFYEGVRALLIDKDNSPQWNPSTLEEVTQETLDHYFSPLDEAKELIL